jgi:hypothetical protein
MRHWQTDVRRPEMTTVDSSAKNMQRRSNTFQTHNDNATWLQTVYSSSFLGWQPAVFMTNTNTQLWNIFDSFKTNYPHFYPYLTSGWVLQGLWLRRWNSSPSNVILHVGSHVRNIALQLFAELWTNAHWASSHSVSCFELRQARCSSDCAAHCTFIAIFFTGLLYM